VEFLNMVIFENKNTCFRSSKRNKDLTDQTGHCVEDRPQADGGYHPFGNGYPTH
jgi:hypothetical protein